MTTSHIAVSVEVVGHMGNLKKEEASVSESRAIVDPEEILSYWFPQATMPIPKPSGSKLCTGSKEDQRSIKR